MASIKDIFYRLVLKNTDAKKKLKETEKAFNGLEKEAKETNKALANTSKQSSNFSSILSSLAGKVAVFFALKAAISGVVSVLKSAIREGLEFTKTITLLGAITNTATEDQKRLEAEALRVGKTTSFTAKAVGELQTEYAKLGFTTDEIIKATEATVNLATFTRDASGSAEVAGATLRGFGLNADKVGVIIDEMALSFSTSALNLEKYRESMKLFAPIAKAYGLSTAQATTVTAKLADAGLYGSIAGTGLKNVFSQLKDEGSSLSQLLGGTANNWQEFIDLLRIAKLRGQEFNDDALANLDERLKAVVINLVDSSDELDNYSNSLLSADGTAKAMAERTLTDLDGKLKLLNSAISGLKIATFKELESFLKDAVDSATSLTLALTPVSTEIDKARESASEQRFEFARLINIYEELRDKTNKTQVEVELYKDTINELKTSYGEYLGNLDLEKDSYNKITVAIQQTNKALEDKILLSFREAEIKDLATANAELRVKEKDLLLEKASLEVRKKQLEELKKGATLALGGGGRFLSEYGKVEFQIRKIGRALSENRTEQNKNANAIQEITDKYRDILNISEKTSEPTTPIIDTELLAKKTKLELEKAFREMSPEKQMEVQGFVKLKPVLDKEDDTAFLDDLLNEDEIATASDKSVNAAIEAERRKNEALGDLGLTEQERKDAEYQRDLLRLMQSGLDYEEYIKRLRQLTKEWADDKAKLDQQTASISESQAKRLIGAVATTAKALAKSKKDQEAIAIGQTVANTVVGMSYALAKPIPDFLTAGIILAEGVAGIASIKSGSLGGSSSGSSGGSFGSGGGATIQTTPTSVSTINQAVNSQNNSIISKQLTDINNSVQAGTMALNDKDLSVTVNSNITPENISIANEQGIEERGF